MLDEGRFFDPDWYREHNPDVVMSGADPFRHFLEQGDREGRSPNAWFSSQDYLSLHPDVAQTGLGAARHFFTHGIREGRLPGTNLALPMNYSLPDTSVEARLHMIREASAQQALYAQAPSLDSLLWFGVLASVAGGSGGAAR